MRFGRQLWMLAGEAGAGKSKLREYIRQLHPDQVICPVAHTTRAMRPGENAGVNYLYVDQLVYQEKYQRGLMLTHWENKDVSYGYAVADVLPFYEQGFTVLLDITVFAFEQVWAIVPEAKGVFLMCENERVQRDRINRRGGMSTADIDARVALSVLERRKALELGTAIRTNKENQLHQTYREVLRAYGQAA